MAAKETAARGGDPATTTTAARGGGHGDARARQRPGAKFGSASRMDGDLAAVAQLNFGFVLIVQSLWFRAASLKNLIQSAASV